MISQSKHALAVPGPHIDLYVIGVMGSLHRGHIISVSGIFLLPSTSYIGTDALRQAKPLVSLATRLPGSAHVPL
jgi:hypothetical protein